VLDVTHADLDAQASPPTEAPPAPPLDLWLPSEPGELTRLRRQLTGWLETLGATRDEQSDIVLAAHEAAANAIQHGADEHPEFRVAAVARHGCVVVRVDDSGHWAPPEGKVPDCGGGHGLAMMQLLMDEVAVHPDGDGTHVRMQRQLASRVGSTA
jgi:anti-sigma regulatory factor (Ser/Thr protein kinase)